MHLQRRQLGVSCTCVPYLLVRTSADVSFLDALSDGCGSAPGVSLQ